MAKKRSAKSKKNLILKIISGVLVAYVLLTSAVSYFDLDIGIPSWQNIVHYTNAGADSNLLESEAANQPLSVHFINVGQGDSTLIVCEEGAVLIDGGDNLHAEDVIYYIRSLGITALDYVIATHPDHDHIGGLDEVLLAFDVETFLMPDTSGMDLGTKTDVLEDTLKTLGTYVEYPTAGDEFWLGDVQFTILAPVRLDYTESNDFSIVVHVKYKDASYLFMGDTGNKVENELMELGYVLPADVLKAGHHGSSSSTSAKFLAQVKPGLVVFSCGENNQYNHPNEKTVNAVIEAGADYFRTDEQGSVVIGTNGQKYLIAYEAA